MAELKLRGINKSFGAVKVIHDVDLDVRDGEFVVFVGPSGCGKSTLLRIVSGLEELSAGQVVIGGEDVTDFDPSERGVAMVFQSYALYPHMTVEQNLGFGLRMGGMARDQVAARVAEAARILELTELLERKPRQLSGGQRQRVAIGRAIVRQPKAFLFDAARPEHDDLVGQRHGFHLVVRHVDHRRLHLAVQAGDLEPHLDAQLGIEV